MDFTEGRTELPSDGVVKEVLDLWRESHKAHEVLIRGRSMFPALREGDVVRVVHEVGNFPPGMIVVFRRGGELIAHRVLRTWPAGHSGRSYLTQGDRCQYPDPKLEAGEILGRVVGIWRNGRYLPVDGRPQMGLGWIIAWSLRMKTMMRRARRKVWRQMPDDAA